MGQEEAGLTKEGEQNLYINVPLSHGGYPHSVLCLEPRHVRYIGWINSFLKSCEAMWPCLFCVVKGNTKIRCVAMDGQIIYQLEKLGWRQGNKGTGSEIYVPALHNWVRISNSSRMSDRKECKQSYLHCMDNADIRTVPYLYRLGVLGMV